MFNSFDQLKTYCADQGIKFVDFKMIDLKVGGTILLCP